MTMTEYRQQKNEERLAAQHPDVQAAAKDIRQTLKDVEQYMIWALDPENEDHGRYDCQNLLDHAHYLVDHAHAYRTAVKANPPPKEEAPQSDKEPDFVPRGYDQRMRDAYFAARPKGDDQ